MISFHIKEIISYPPKLEIFGVTHSDNTQLKLQIQRESFLLSVILFGYFLIVEREKNLNQEKFL